MRYDNIVANVPLVVDLDHTLIAGDIAMESLVRQATRGLRAFLGVLWCLLRGPAAVKCHLARHAPVDPARLAYRPEVLALIAEARAERRPVILASAAHWRNARAVARHLGGFDQVIASSARNNVKGRAKLAAINAAVGGNTLDTMDEAAMQSRFTGLRPLVDGIYGYAFDYVGDAAADRPIWQAARTAYTVGVATDTAHETRLAPRPNLARTLLRAARPHQWAKNALVLVPLVSSGLLLNIGAIGRSLAAFAFLSLIASSVYLLNDLVDIDSDRLHPKKSKRPLASGAMPIPVAVMAAVLGAGVGLAGSWFVLGPIGFATMATYFALTVAYSLRLKSAMIADVLTLACLYTIRIIAGAAAIAVPVSFWLLLFSVFFFLSLGYLKRYVELSTSPREDHQLLSGRGYTGLDTDIVAISGIAAAMVSVLTMVMFAEAMAKTQSYGTPQLLWLLPLPLLYWLNRIWLMGRRGHVDSDPVAFALTDRKSIVVGGIIGIILLVAKFAVLAPAMGAIGIS